MNERQKYLAARAALSAACAVLVAFAVQAQVDLGAAARAENPNALIEASAKKMLEELDAHRAEYRADPKKVYRLVDEVLLPYFDTEYAARLVLGQHWRSATPEQRKRFVDAFYRSLLENYGTALLDFTADRLVVLPLRGKPDGRSATVRTQVKRNDGTRVDVNYSMRRTDAGWRAWDVVIEGISYVRNYRMDFGAEIDRKGLDSVIRRLETEGYQPKSKG